MSLNTAHTPDGNGVLLYNGELILVYAKNVTLEFEATDPVFKGKKKGPLYLTSHRIVFTNQDHKDRLQSFSSPFHSLRDVKLEQPVFGANYLKGQVLAQPGGNWTGDAVFKMTFYDGGCIEFGEALLNAAELARQYVSEFAPPAYTPPAGGYFSAPPSYYSYSGNDYYGLHVPTEAFPNAPEPGTVYMYEAPPPYTGIAPPHAQQQHQNGTANAKAAEANQSGAAAAYYNGDPYATKPPDYDQINKQR